MESFCHIAKSYIKMTPEVLTYVVRPKYARRTIGSHAILGVVVVDGVLQIMGHSDNGKEKIL